MKRSHAAAFVLAAALIAAAATMAMAATTNWYNAKGYVYYYTAENVLTKKMFLQVRDVHQEQVAHEDQTFHCYFEDVEINVPVSHIRSLTREEGTNYVIVTRRDGYSYRAEMPRNMGYSLTGFNWPGFLMYNEITDSFEDGFVAGDTIMRIEFVDSF